MTTMAENERLAVLETHVSRLQTDVQEIKSDVKALVKAVEGLTASNEAREAADAVKAKSRADTGVWVRAFGPWLIGAGGLVLSIINLLKG